MNNSVEIRGLHKNFDTFSLADVTFSVPQGYIMGFIGPNGAGKTTTIKSILQLTDYSSGSIALFGKEYDKNNIALLEDVGVLMDAPLYPDEWTVADVEKAVSPFYKSWNAQRFTALLDKFSIEQSKKTSELSRGMKVKLMMAVALSHDAKLLILDEPTSGLDPVARDELCEILSEFVLDESRSVLFSTHITADLEKIADYITFILDGRILFSGPKEELLEAYFSVKGGNDEISTEHESYLIGLRKHSTGFEAIVKTSDIPHLPECLLIEPVSLDEIILFINKGAKKHE